MGKESKENAGQEEIKTLFAGGGNPCVDALIDQVARLVSPVTVPFLDRLERTADRVNVTNIARATYVTTTLGLFYSGAFLGANPYILTFGVGAGILAAFKDDPR